MDREFRGKPLCDWLSAVEPALLTLSADEGIANNPRLSAIVYPQAASLPDTEPAELFEALFDLNAWPSAWRNGVFDYHHFHTTAHEVIGVYSGNVTVQLGGAAGPHIVLKAGDIAIIPAGVAHKNLGDSGDLGIVGAYPEGQTADLGTPDTLRLAQFALAVEQVPRPLADPAYGKQGPLMNLWS